MVASLFELHDVAAEPFFHIFYSCDASGSVDIVEVPHVAGQPFLFVPHNRVISVTSLGIPDLSPLASGERKVN